VVDYALVSYGETMSQEPDQQAGEKSLASPAPYQTPRLTRHGTLSSLTGSNTNPGGGDPLTGLSLPGT